MAAAWSGLSRDPETNIKVSGRLCVRQLPHKLRSRHLNEATPQVQFPVCSSSAEHERGRIVRNPPQHPAAGLGHRTRALESENSTAIREYKRCWRSAWKEWCVGPQRSRGSRVRARDIQPEEVRAFGEAESKEGRGPGFLGCESRFAFGSLCAPEIFNYTRIQGKQVSYEKLNCP